MLISRAEMVWALVVCLKEAGDKKLFEYFTLALIMISLESLGLIDNLNLNFIFHNVRTCSKLVIETIDIGCLFRVHEFNRQQQPKWQEISL